MGFILGADIPPEGCSQEEAAAAIEWVVPSIELIDSRIKDWKITLGDTIADNASSCGYVVGSGRVRLADIDVAAIEATLYKNGEFLPPAVPTPCWVTRSTPSAGWPRPSRSSACARARAT